MKKLFAAAAEALTAFAPALLTVLAGCTYLPWPLGETPGVQVTETRDSIELRTVPETEGGPALSSLGLMVWPGGLVDAHAYVASLAPFAARGRRVVIAKVPLNLAIADIPKGLALARSLGGDWVAAGHSLGGTAAAWTVHDHPGAFKGLALLASYPADDKPLTDWNGAVLSVYAENDGLAPPEEIASTRPLLPPEGPGTGATRYVEIAGGNHAGFGAYGPQENDGTATISASAQWEALADALDLLWSDLEALP